jgi:acyl-ACP thioesterase
VNYGEGNFLEGNGEEKDFVKIIPFITESEKINVKPSYLDIDHNGHINNTKYVNYIFNNLNELQDKEIVEFQMEYVQELRKNQEFYLSYTKKENEFYIKGESDKGVHFITKIITL